MDMRGIVDSIRSEDIVVTGSRMSTESLQSLSPVTTISAEREDLGDLKLYRIPEPVTVAANSQKQVALLHQGNVQASLVYRYGGWVIEQESSASRLVLITRNRRSEGLGLPLPAGRLILFAAGNVRPILLGEGTMEDRAVGEDVEVDLGPAEGVRTQLRPISLGGDAQRYELVVTNDQSSPIHFEAEYSGLKEVRPRSGSLRRRRNGMNVWTVTVPANGSATLNVGFERDSD